MLPHTSNATSKKLWGVGFKGCLQVNFWLKFLLGDNKMMTLLPEM